MTDFCDSLVSNLIENEIKEMSINAEFLDDKNMSFKEFLDNTIHLETQYYDVINPFYKRAWISPDKLTYLDTFPEYGESSGNYRYRFLIININNDFVFINMKVIDPRNGADRYFHIYRPISYNGSIDNELEVLSKLSEFSFIKDMVILSSNGDFSEWCNNYYNTKESCEYMFKSKWKSKHCINKIDNIVSREFIDYDNGILTDEIMEFSERWESIRKDKSEKKSDKKLISMMNKSNSIRMLVIRVKGKIVAFNIAFIYLSKYVVIHTAKYLSVGSEEYLMDYLDIDFDTAKLLRYNLSAYMQYITHKEYLVDKHYDAFYYEGDTHLSWLRKYKQMFFRNIIFYKKIPISEYLASNV